MKCPKCDSDLVKRKGKLGEFWGCSKYPDCNYTTSMKEEVISDRSDDIHFQVCLKIASEQLRTASVKELVDFDQTD